MVVTKYELEFRLHVIRDGIRVTLGLAAAGVLYLLLTWDQPYRPLLIAVSLLAALDALLISRLPHRRILKAGRGDALLGIWNVIHIAVTIVICGLDGGDVSPFRTLFFICTAFAAISLPPRLITVVATLDVFALITVGGPTAETLFWSIALLVTGVVCWSISADRVRRVAEVQDANEAMLRRLARVVEYRDNETGNHVERMGTVCGILGRRFGLSAGPSAELQLASTMHDIGKVAVPDAILLKPGKLTGVERIEMQRHAQVGHDMLTSSDSQLFQLAATIAVTHHERHDGRGYPNGLHGVRRDLTAAAPDHGRRDA
ncbi:MAG: two-component system, response regulator RpfG [Gaiellales bacterium]|nr:two-component system, response regulator RpfG [Gaiellales bacterium]